MATRVEEFLAPAIEGARMLLFEHPQNDSQIDSLLGQLGVIALAEVETWLRRPVVLPAVGSYYVDRYLLGVRTSDPVRLRATPVAAQGINKVELQVEDPASGFEVLTEGSDWKLEGDSLYLPGLAGPSRFFGRERPVLRVTYRGGWNVSSDNIVIHSALVQQITGLYNTRAYIGYSYAGGSKAVKVDLDTECGLFRPVVALLESLVYVGDGGPW